MVLFEGLACAVVCVQVQVAVRLQVSGHPDKTTVRVQALHFWCHCELSTVKSNKWGEYTVEGVWFTWMFPSHGNARSCFKTKVMTKIKSNIQTLYNISFRPRYNNPRHPHACPNHAKSSSAALNLTVMQGTEAEGQVQQVEKSVDTTTRNTTVPQTKKDL